MTPPPKAPRPQFFEDAASDRLTAIITALTTEVAVLSDRLATVEALLVQNNVLAQGMVDAHEPDAEALAARRQRYAAFTNRVFYVLQEELDSLAPPEAASGTTAS